MGSSKVLTPGKWRKRAGLFLAAAIMSTALTSGAHAGFEWTPPPAKAAPVQPQPGPDVMPMPAMAVEVEEIVVPALDPFPVNNVPFDKAYDTVNEEPPAPVSAPLLSPAPLPVAVSAPVKPPAPKEVFDDAVGFGSDIPLVIAMRQIVPAQYSYAFDPAVDRALRVSWNGGKPWNEALQDAVLPYNLEVVIADKTVWLRPATGDQLMADKVASMQPEPPAMTVSPAAPVMPATDPAVMMPEPPLTTGPAYNPALADGRLVSTAEAIAASQRQEQMMIPQSYPRRLAGHTAETAAVVAPQETIIFNTAAPVVPPAEIPMKAQRAPEGDQRDTLSRTPPPLEMMPAANNNAPIPLMTQDSMVMPPPSLPPAPMAAPMAPPMKAAVSETAMPSHSGNPVMDPYEIRFWHANAGDSLKNVLERWSSSANVAILWQSPTDYRLPVPVRMHGTFPDAVTEILTRFNATDPRPLGQLHPNLPTGPSVLIVENYTSATH